MTAVMAVSGWFSRWSHRRPRITSLSTLKFLTLKPSILAMSQSFSRLGGHGLFRGSLNTPCKGVKILGTLLPDQVDATRCLFRQSLSPAGRL